MPSEVIEMYILIFTGISKSAFYNSLSLPNYWQEISCRYNVYSNILYFQFLLCRPGGQPMKFEYSANKEKKIDYD